LRGIRAKSQVSFPVCYKGQRLGDYVADLVIEDKLLVELQCVDRFGKEHRSKFSKIYFQFRALAEEQAAIALACAEGLRRQRLPVALTDTTKP
jgi:hypothetical protein